MTGTLLSAGLWLGAGALLVGAGYAWGVRSGAPAWMPETIAGSSGGASRGSTPSAELRAEAREWRERAEKAESELESLRARLAAAEVAAQRHQAEVADRQVQQLLGAR